MLRNKFIQFKLLGVCVVCKVSFKVLNEFYKGRSTPQPIITQHAKLSTEFYSHAGYDIVLDIIHSYQQFLFIS